MVDVDVLPPSVEVRWDGEAWTDVTAQVRALEGRHGGARRANPDRPTIASAAGSVTTTGEVPQSRRAGRFRIRLRVGTDLLWEGWVSEPDISPGPPPSAVWSLAGLSREGLSVEATLASAASTVSALMATEAAGSGSVSGVPDRATVPLSVTDRRGAVMSRLASVGAADVVERRDGSVRYTGYAPAAAPTDAASVDSSSLVGVRVASADRADRIRNTAPGGEPANASVMLDLSITAPTALPSGPELVGTAAFVVPAGGRVAAATVASVTVERRIPGAIRVAQITAGRPNRWQFVAEGAPLSEGLVAWSWVRVEGAVASVTTAGRVTVDIPDIAALGGSFNGGVASYFNGPQTLRGWSAISEATASLPVNLGPTTSSSTFDDFIGGWRDSRYRVYGLRATVNISYQTVAVIEDAASIAIWGRRPTDLPNWLAADADLRAQVSQLAGLRREHLVTVPVRQPDPAQRAIAATLDAGDYAALNLVDTARGVDINEHCTVTSRTMRWRLGSPLTVSWLCRELGHTAAAAAPDTPANLAAAPADGALAASWDATARAATYELRHRPSSGGGWTTITGIAATGHTIGGLVNGRRYDLQAAARNSGGLSPWSATVTATPAAPSGPPPAPVPTLTAADSELTLTWPLVPEATTYRYRYRAGSTGAWTVHTVASGPVTISATNGTTYQVELQAVNAHGVSAYVRRTATPAAPPPVLTAPGAPRALTAGTATASTIPVTWTAPAAGGAVGHYDGRIRAGTTGAWTTVTPIAGTGHTFTGLAASTSHQVEVRAVNTAGASTWVRVTAATAATAPSASALVISLGTTVSARVQQMNWVYAVPEGKALNRVEYFIRAPSAAWPANPFATTRASGSYVLITPSLQSGWQIRARARHTDGTYSTWSNTLTGPPARSPGPTLAALTLDDRLINADDRPLTLRDQGDQP